MNFEQAIVQVQDTLIVMTEIQRRQAEVQRTQAEEVALHAQLLRHLREGMDLHEKRMNHIDLTLAEIGDKLNGLIGFVGGFFDKPKT
jgi:hypothetical protein